MRDQDKSKAELIAELETLRQSNAEFRHGIARQLAVARVRAEVMAMRSADDLMRVVAVMHQGMVGQGIDTMATGINFLDDATGNMRIYYAIENPRKHGISWRAKSLVEFDGETVVCSEENPPGPLWDGWKREWEAHRRTGEHWSAEVEPGVLEADFAADFRRWGCDRPAPIPPAAGRVVTNVPFEYGTVGYNEPVHHPEHVPLVRDMTAALSLGYLRFLDFQRLAAQNRQLQHEVALRRLLKTQLSDMAVRNAQAWGLEGLVAHSAAMGALMRQIDALHEERSEGCVFLHGEEGTGKELLARAIHSGSSRSGGPFTKLDCSDMPQDVVGSMEERTEALSRLFGHAAGAIPGVGRSARAPSRCRTRAPCS